MSGHRCVAAWSGAGVLTALAAGITIFEWRSVVGLGDPTLLEDLHIYRGAVILASTGASLYDYSGVGPFTYPPFAAVLMQPLTWLPAPWSDGLWTLAILLSTVAFCATLVARTPKTHTSWVGIAPRTSRMLALTSVASILLLTSVPIVVNLWLGQVSVAVTLLALLDAGGVVPKRVQGVLIGIASALKLTPLIFIPYFLVTRQWRQATISAGVFVGATGVGFLFYPQDSIAYWTDLVFDTSRVGELGVPRNASILGLMTRWDIGGSSQRTIWLALCAALLAVALLRSREHFTRGQLMPAAVVMGCASLVVSPISWPHHLVWVGLAGLWLLLQRRPSVALLGAAILLINNLVWPMLLPVGLPDLALRVAVELPALCALAVCLLGLPDHQDGPLNLGDAVPSVPSSAIA